MDSPVVQHGWRTVLRGTRYAEAKAWFVAGHMLWAVMLRRQVRAVLNQYSRRF